LALSINSFAIWNLDLSRYSLKPRNSIFEMIEILNEVENTDITFSLCDLKIVHQ
jgi:hypothetical protein